MTSFVQLLVAKMPRMSLPSESAISAPTTIATPTMNAIDFAPQWIGEPSSSSRPAAANAARSSRCPRCRGTCRPRPCRSGASMLKSAGEDQPEHAERERGDADQRDRTLGERHAAAGPGVSSYLSAAMVFLLEAVIRRIPARGRDQPWCQPMSTAVRLCEHAPRARSCCSRSAAARGAGSASAAPFGELPFRPVSGAATCLRATGAPGELVRAPATGAEVLRAGPAGSDAGRRLPPADARRLPARRRRGRAAPGWSRTPRATATTPSRSSRRVVREPGGSWGPVDRRAAAPGPATARRVGVSERGDALVASRLRPVLVASQIRRGPARAGRGLRRPGDAVLRAPQRRARRPDGAGGDERRGRGGRGLVVPPARERAARVVGRGRRPRRRVRRAGADRHAAQPGAFDLAVGADGRALLAFAAGDELHVAERAPGGAFGAATAVAGRRATCSARSPAVALRADGGAVVAW